MLLHIYPKGTFKDSDKELSPFSILRSVMFFKQSYFFYILSFDAVDAVSLECRIWSWSPMPCEKHGPRHSEEHGMGYHDQMLL